MRLLILGTGNMAQNHANHFAEIPGVTLAGAIEINDERRAAFASKNNIANTFASVTDAINWNQFDAVTNVTPDAVHHATTMPFLNASKHVLCEKPLATNAKDAQEMAQAAEKAGVINMVNLTYRNVAALQETHKLVASGAIGDVRHMEAAYLQSWLTQDSWGDWQTDDTWLWRLSTAHGSHGVLGDVGVHIVDFASYAANMTLTEVQANLHTFHKAAGDKIKDYTLDANDSFTLSGRMQNGALAAIHATRFASGHHNDLSLRIFGTKGGIEITNSGDLGTMRTCLGDDVKPAKWTETTLTKPPTIYQRFTDAVKTGVNPGPDFKHAAQLQSVLDAAIQSDTTGQAVQIL